MMTTPRLLTAGGVALALLISAAPASAFFEDLCYRPAGGLMNCLPVPAGCAPSDDRAACRSGAVLQAATVASQTDGGRSMLHVDATYYLAQAVGFSPEAAYWIAAYDEATDLGQFVPADRDGRPLVDPQACAGAAPPAACAWVTATIDGVTRNNNITGGITLHFVSPYNPAGDVLDGLAPDVHDALHEVALVNFRRWAFDDVAACVGGLTVESAAGDFSTGLMCADLVPGQSTLDGTVPLLAPVAAGLPMSVPLGEQILSQTAGEILVGDIATLVGVDVAPYARMGIYLHILQDRISHHVCADHSTYTGPIAPEQDFSVEYDNTECAQPIHVLRHAWEIGVNQAALDSEDRTTQAALSMTYDELLALAQQLGVARRRAGRAAYRTSVLNAVQAELQVEDPVARQDGLSSAMLARGFDALPGYTAP